MTATATDPNDALAAERLARLTAFLEQDSVNLSLLSDAAETALIAGDVASAGIMLDRYDAMFGAPMVAARRRRPTVGAAKT